MPEHDGGLSDMTPRERDTMATVASLTAKMCRITAEVLIGAGGNAEAAILLVREVRDGESGLFDGLPFDGLVMVEQSIRDARKRLLEAIEDAERDE